MFVVNMDCVGPLKDSYEHLFEEDAAKESERLFDVYTEVLKRHVPEGSREVIDEVVMEYVSYCEKRSFEDGMNCGAQMMNRMMNRRGKGL